MEYTRTNHRLDVRRAWRKVVICHRAIRVRNVRILVRKRKEVRLVEGGVAIPDDDEAGITATAEVPAGASGTVSIELDITHSWRGDLEVRVSHGEQSFVLHDREGGSAENLSGSFPLDATGNAFEGDPVGTWTLHVADRAGADTGTLNSWAVVVTP